MLETLRVRLLHFLTELPWTPLYTQTSTTSTSILPTQDTSHVSSILFTYGMVWTVLFTVLVYLLERILDERQAQAYRKTDFPEQLEKTISKIDSENKNKKKESSIPVDGIDTTTTKDTKKDGLTQQQTHTSDDAKEKESTSRKNIDTDKPLLPQLKEKFSKAQAYGTDKMNFGMFSSTFHLMEGILLLFLGYLPYAWDMSLRFAQRYLDWNETQHEIRITLVFLAWTSLLSTITDLPFELYSTFRIEKKHGFNKQTLGLFFTDKVKSLILTFAIGGPFIALLLRIIQWGGDFFYLYVWVFMFLFSIFMMTIVPVFIMPLFNKYEPLKDGPLKEKIFELARTLHYPLTKLFVMDGSKRSSHSNAFMFGFGNNKRIVLFDTLMDQVEEDEILAILGHELGHWKLGHTLINFAVTQVYVGCAFYCFSLCYKSNGLYRAFGFDGIDRPVPIVVALILFFQTLWAPMDKILSFVLTVFSRQCEFAADRFSAALGMSQKLQTGLCKISLENLGAMCPDSWYATYHYSHPPLVERLSAMMALESKNK